MVGQAAENVERHGERTARWRLFRQQCDRRAIDTLSHRFSTGLDLVARGFRSSTARKGGSRVIHPLCLFVDRTLNVFWIDALRGELERPVCQCLGGQLPGARIRNSGENALRNVGGKDFPQTRRRILCGSLGARSLRNQYGRHEEHGDVSNVVHIFDLRRGAICDTAAPVWCSSPEFRRSYLIDSPFRCQSHIPPIR